MSKLYWRFISAGLRTFFKLLYGPLAWTYDGVAAVVSLGKWRSWVLCALPYLEGPRVLELGHGPGHLQTALRQGGLQAVGLDLSRQMGLLAYTNQKNLAIEPLLVNGYAQFIPFSPSSFDQVAATFPAEYFWDLRTLQEVARVLRPGGTLLALPAAWITGSKPLQQAAHWLFQITGQAPARQDGPFLEEIISRLNSAGFQVDHEYKALKDSTVLLLIARKKAE